MPTNLIPGLSRDLCARRERAAALAGVEAAPLRLLREVPASGALGARAVGTLPQSDDACMAAINAGLPAGAKPLTRDQVHIHFAEAANSSFVPDRFLFLDSSTLRNIARDAAAGVSFMNSHRTGGMSHPSELPYGKTFAGRYEATPDGRERTLVGFYMLAGREEPGPPGPDGEPTAARKPICPNGAGGPSTDDLHHLIEGGQLQDVSVGLYGGKPRCDVCGADMASPCEMEFADDGGCGHVPGTTRGLKKPDMERQRQRGVPGGEASYSLCDARMGELSGVFDGAVPGAGFRFTFEGEAPEAASAPLFAGMVPGAGFARALGLFQAGRLEPAYALEARQAFATCLGRHDFDPATYRTNDQGFPERLTPPSGATALGAEPYHGDLPLADRDHEWDGGAAEQRMQAAASRDGSGDPDTIDWSAYGRGFLWHEDEPEKIGDFKLPICDVLAGKLTAIPKGIFAAEARLGQTDIPTEDKAGVKKTLARWHERIESESGDSDEAARASTVPGPQGSGEDPFLPGAGLSLIDYSRYAATAVAGCADRLEARRAARQREGRSDSPATVAAAETLRAACAQTAERLTAWLSVASTSPTAASGAPIPPGPGLRLKCAALQREARLRAARAGLSAAPGAPPVRGSES